MLDFARNLLGIFDWTVGKREASAVGKRGRGRAKFANDWSHNILHVSTKGEYGEGPDFAND